MCSMKTIRLSDELVSRIDAARGLVPREAWVRRTLEETLLARRAEASYAHTLGTETARIPLEEKQPVPKGEPCPSCGFLGGEHDFDCERNTDG